MSALVNGLLNRSLGSCSRGCTTRDRLHWWGAGIGDAGCARLGERLDGGELQLANLLLGGNGLGDACMRTGWLPLPQTP